MVDLVLGDDHEIFVDALLSALPRWGFTVAGTAGSIAATKTSVRQHDPDVCLLDRYFTDGDGIEAIGEINAISRDRTKVLLLTADGDVRAMRKALGAGAAGYVNKTCGLEVLTSAIREVAEGEIVVELAAAKAPPLSGSADALRLMAQLTARERECLELLVDGVATEAMASRLRVSPTTIRTHVQAILTKLGVHSRLEVAAFVLRYSLLDQGEPWGPAMAGVRRDDSS